MTAASTSAFRSWEGREPLALFPRVSLYATGGEQVLLCRVRYEQDAHVPRHAHEQTEQVMLMLDGELEVLNGEDVVTVRTGDMLFVPPHTTHAFGASERSGADVLIVFTPGVERFEYFRMIDRIRRGEASPAEILASQDRFDNHFVDSATWRAARAA